MGARVHYCGVCANRVRIMLAIDALCCNDDDRDENATNIFRLCSIRICLPLVKHLFILVLRCAVLIDLLECVRVLMHNAHTHANAPAHVHTHATHTHIFTFSHDALTGLEGLHPTVEGTHEVLPWRDRPLAEGHAYQALRATPAERPAPARILIVKIVSIRAYGSISEHRKRMLSDPTVVALW
jgi:hypothetical protein